MYCISDHSIAQRNEADGGKGNSFILFVSIVLHWLIHVCKSCTIASNSYRNSGKSIGNKIKAKDTSWFLKVSYMTKVKVYLDCIDFELFVLNFDSQENCRIKIVSHILSLFKLNNYPNKVNLKVVIAYDLVNKATHIVG